VKSGFITLVNNWALHIISTPCVLYGHVLVSEALPEFKKIVLKHVTEHVNYIGAQALFKVI